MGVYFKTADGTKGMLDIAMFLREQGLIPFAVKDGNVRFTSEDGREGIFSLAQWLIENEATLLSLDGFNTPATALDLPPTGMTTLDQAVFANNGKNIKALYSLFKDVRNREDGSTVVLDADGLWKTMWSNKWTAPQPFPDYDKAVGLGIAIDPSLALRGAMIAWLFALSGIEPKIKDGEISPVDLPKMLRSICNSAPLETKVMLGNLVNQTTGLDTWKFNNALYFPEHLTTWLKSVLEMDGFEFRMKQTGMAQAVIAALHRLQLEEFMSSMTALSKQPETKGLLVNLKEVTDEFIITLTSLDVIRDISKITGLDDFKAAKSGLIKEENLPPMSSFIPKLTDLIRWIMPISQQSTLALVRGKRGLDAITALMVKVDSAIYSLTEVPDSQAKSKMFMALRNVQTKLENKLSIFYHPTKDRSGEDPNLFMHIKTLYGPKRDILYRIAQVPKESWPLLIMETLRAEPNIEAFYDTLPNSFSNIIKSFVAMDIAYDMQPWVDSNYMERLDDSFSKTFTSFGELPPTSGYMSKHEPRMVLNVVETLSISAAMLSTMEGARRRELLRSPAMFDHMLQVIRDAVTNREMGAMEAMAQIAIRQDPYNAVDVTRLWEDPELVYKQNQEEAKMMMEQAQAEQMMKEQQESLKQEQLSKESQVMQGADPGVPQEQGAPPGGMPPGMAG